MSIRLSSGLFIPTFGDGYYGCPEEEARRIGKEGFAFLDRDMTFLYDPILCNDQAKEQAILEGRETYGRLEGKFGPSVLEDDGQKVVIAREHLDRVRVTAFYIYSLLKR